MRAKTAAKANPQSKARVSTELILKTAMAIVDREGLDALTMRRLASDLSVEPVTIYRRIPSKDQLLAELVKLMQSEVRHDAPHGSWKDQLRLVMQSYFAAGLAHPAIASISRKYSERDYIFSHFEQDLRRMIEAGFTPDNAGKAFRALTNYVNGFTYHRGAPGVDDGELSVKYPHVFLARHYLDARNVDAFEYGLEALLNGIEQTLLEQSAKSGAKVRARKPQ